MCVCERERKRDRQRLQDLKDNLGGSVKEEPDTKIEETLSQSYGEAKGSPVSTPDCKRSLDPELLSMAVLENDGYGPGSPSPACPADDETLDAAPRIVINAGS